MLHALPLAVLGTNASGREKIRVMAQFVEAPSSADEIERACIMAAIRFRRLGLSDRAEEFLSLYTILKRERLEGLVYLLVVLSQRHRDSVFVDQNHPPAFITSSSIYPSLSLTSHFYHSSPSSPTVSTCISLQDFFKECASASVDDGCVKSGQDSMVYSSREECRCLSRRFSSLLSNPRRHLLREWAEAEIGSVAEAIATALAGSPSFLFPLQDGRFVFIPYAYVTGCSVGRSRALVSQPLWIANKLLHLEHDLKQNLLGNSHLDSELARLSLDSLTLFRSTELGILHTRPFPSVGVIVDNLRELVERGQRMICLLQIIVDLQGVTACDALDHLYAQLRSCGLADPRLARKLLPLIRSLLHLIAQESSTFMRTGFFSSSGVILQSHPDMLRDASSVLGKAEGERWRRDYGLLVPHGHLFCSALAQQILDQGKLAIMLRRREVVGGRVEGGGVEREQYDDEVIEDINWDDLQEDVTQEDISKAFQLLIDVISQSGCRPSFLASQLCQAANSLQVIKEICLLGDGHFAIQLVQLPILDRLSLIHEAVHNFQAKHLIHIDYLSGSHRLAVVVEGALSVIVSSSNMRVYTAAHSLLFLLTRAVHMLSCSYFCLPSVFSASALSRSLSLAHHECSLWLQALRAHFLTQTHQVVWRSILKDGLCSLPSFSLAYSLHRQGIRALALRLLQDSYSRDLLLALTDGINHCIAFSNYLQEGNHHGASRSYTQFVNCAQLFTQGLNVSDNSDSWKHQLLHRLDSRRFYQDSISSPD